MLENREGLKIGMIVNDVASINVDAKLVRATNTDDGELPPDTVQLENGKASAPVLQAECQRSVIALLKS
jgi:G3E family GTPase